MHLLSRSVLATALLLQCFALVKASTITPAPKATSADSPLPTISNGTCEFRTINYITDSLPQLCLKNSWRSENATVRGPEENVNGTNTESATPNPTSTEIPDPSSTDLETGELNDASFLSFEEWKKQTLEKAGQAGIAGRKEGKKRDSESFQNNLEGLGEEGEIEVDFGVFRSGGREEKQAEKEEKVEAEEVARGSDNYRSKDAGKTCKERFSYASFDAGATILKTHQGAKNSKAVLIENKDSYMLSECSVENKFIIIELSEDIWIDTVVLANYEFFSSMIRQFRVSVSDRYPVKIDKWKDVGTYEARNSRDIQAFLIENPQIWARYIRIEFLSHYGNEYYCPLSLVRVHGTRMLESWKETEAIGEEDEGEESEAEDQYIPEAVAEAVRAEEKLKAATEAMAKTAQEMVVNATKALQSEPRMEISPWKKFDFYALNNTHRISDTAGSNLDVCLPADAPIAKTSTSSTAAPNASSIIQTSQISPSPAAAAANLTSTSSILMTPKAETAVVSNSTASESVISRQSNVTSNSDSPTTITSHPNAKTYSTSTTKAQNVTSSIKNKTSSTTSSASSLPTIQESFFKAVSRRLNFLETNSTLSLQYISEQSRILREAFTKVEKKQLQKTNTFLDTLNSTVLSELRNFRQQYDEIWQSTVISLESQREESRREILAISTRLNILADEVVFQKRMSIIQSVLLLLCLGLVIFSRVSSTGTIDFQFPIRRGLESPVDPESPEFTRLRGDRRWLEVDDRRRNERSTSRDDCPPTPISAYSHSHSPSNEEDITLTPPSAEEYSTHLQPQRMDSVKSTTDASYRSLPPSPQASIEIENDLPALPVEESPLRTPKKRKAFVRPTPPPDYDLPASSPPRERQVEDWPLSNSSPAPQSSRSEIERGTEYPSPSPDPQLPERSPLRDSVGAEGLVGGGIPVRDTGVREGSVEASTPSSKREKRQSFSIARKPLPALPTE